MPQLTDEDLIVAVRKGDLDAYGSLVKKYQALVFGVAFNLIGNVEDSQDVAQDVFIRVFVRLDQLRDTSRVGSWIRQIAVNECRAFLQRRREIEPLEDRHISVDPIDDMDRRLIVDLALSAIDEASRLTVILFYLHAHSLKEIGSFLDEPVTTIKSRLRNARTKMRKELELSLENNLKQESPSPEFATRVTLIIEAVQSGNEKAIRDLLAADPRLVSVTEEPSKQTPLHIAAGSGNAALVELLLAHGANPNALDRGDNASPLHYAAEKGWLEAVRLLVEAGSDVNWDLDIHLRGPLGWATMMLTGENPVAEYLIANGAKLSIFTAIALGRIDTVKEVVDRDPWVLRQRMSKCELFLSPIEYATDCRQFEIANLLVELGSDVSLSEAAGLGLEGEVLRRLAENPGAPNLLAAIWSAVKAGQLRTTRLLLEHGVDPNSTLRPQEGRSLLFWAVSDNNESMSRLLLEFGADLEFQDSQWKSTPLGWEVFYGKPESTSLACRLGAKIGSNLLDLAKAGERGELRRWSNGTPEGYRLVHKVLEEAITKPG